MATPTSDEDLYYKCVGALTDLLMEYFWIAEPNIHKEREKSDWAWETHLKDREFMKEKSLGFVRELETRKSFRAAQCNALYQELSSAEDAMTDFVKQHRSDQAALEAKFPEFQDFHDDFSEKLEFAVDH